MLKWSIRSVKDMKDVYLYNVEQRLKCSIKMAKKKKCIYIFKKTCCELSLVCGYINSMTVLLSASTHCLYPQTILCTRGKQCKLGSDKSELHFFFPTKSSTGSLWEVTAHKRLKCRSVDCVSCSVSTPFWASTYRADVYAVVEKEV